jgi:hypothetical protein
MGVLCDMSTPEDVRKIIPAVYFFYKKLLYKNRSRARKKKYEKRSNRRYSEFR